MTPASRDWSAEFWREFLGLRYREDDELSAEGPDEPLWVLADPAGHPFCVFVG